MPTKNVLFLDDAVEVREAVGDFLVEAGYQVKYVSDAEQALQALKANPYFAMLLDIDLGPESPSVGQLLAAFENLFPEVDFDPEAVLSDLGLNRESGVNGKMVLPMVKAVAPTTEVIMLTGTYHDIDQEQYMRKWGARATVQKLSEDVDFSKEDNVVGLDEELLGHLDEIRQEQLK